MAGVSNYDIYDSVYLNIKGSYLKGFDYVSIKSRTVSENASDEENSSLTEILDPATKTTISTREQDGSMTETVRETIERMAEDEAILKIRKDLEERFPYALGSACSNLAVLDREYRAAVGEGEQPQFSPFMVDVDDVFPLSERFAYACVLYISSMILMDVDEKLSDGYYEKYASSVSRIVKEIPYRSSSTVEKYPY